jgi:aminoglycoside phosphotransferase (APT) family kinase protein
VSGLEGRRLVGEGREAEIFEWDGNTVLRLLRDPAHGARLGAEAVAMRAAGACGVPVPTVGDQLTVEGRPGLVLGRVDGPDLITRMGSRPWTVVGAAAQLGRIHAQLHEVVAPPELPALREHVRARIAASPLPARLTEHALAELEQLPDGERLCHGDFHPGNVLVGSGGPVVIDWVNATRGDPAADLARTRLMLQVGALPPGTRRLIVTLDRTGRALFRRQWLSSYRRRRAVDDALVDRWTVVRAADRSAEGIEPEIPALRAILERSAGVER